MNGDRGAAVKQIMQAIEYGTLPTDETQRRLMELIQKEASRIDGPADEELLSACIDLMERLQGREPVEDEERIAALNQRIADAIQKKKQSQERWHTALRAVGTIAAVLVLIVGIGVPLRWTWFESWSTPDEQQHVIMGHEITVDMVASAIAEHGSTDRVDIDDFSKISELLGLNLYIPDSLGENWVAQSGYIDYPKGYIKISLSYTNKNDAQKQISCTICLHSDVEYAYYSFEQSKEGSLYMIGNASIYASNNIDRTSVCWYDNNTYVWLSGNLSIDNAVRLIYELIGGISTYAK